MTGRQLLHWFAVVTCGGWWFAWMAGEAIAGAALLLVSLAAMLILLKTGDGR